MRAELRGLDFEPEPRALPADPAAFTFQARLYIGPAADRGEESFDVTVCSPEWLAARCQREGVVRAWSGRFITSWSPSIASMSEPCATGSTSRCSAPRASPGGTLPSSCPDSGTGSSAAIGNTVTKGDRAEVPLSRGWRRLYRRDRVSRQGSPYGTTSRPKMQAASGLTSSRACCGDRGQAALGSACGAEGGLMVDVGRNPLAPLPSLR